MNGLDEGRAVGLHVVPVVADPVDLLRAQGQIGEEQHVIADADGDLVRYVIPGVDAQAAQECQLVAIACELAVIGGEVVVRRAVGLGDRALGEVVEDAGLERGAEVQVTEFQQVAVQDELGAVEFVLWCWPNA